MFVDVQKHSMKLKEGEQITERQEARLKAESEEAGKTRTYKTKEEEKTRKGKTELAQFKSDLRVSPKPNLKRGGLSDKVKKETIGKMVATAVTNKADMEPEDFETHSKTGKG